MRMLCTIKALATWESVYKRVAAKKMSVQFPPLSSQYRNFERYQKALTVRENLSLD